MIDLAGHHLNMTLTGLGRHASKPTLEWDDVDMDDGTQDISTSTTEATQHHAQVTGLAVTEGKDKGASPWFSMRTLFRR